MALRWEDVELEDGTIHVTRGWDREGPTSTKNRGRRRVPITAALRENLAVQRLRQTPASTWSSGSDPDVPSTHRRRRHAPTMGGRRQASTA